MRDPNNNGSQAVDIVNSQVLNSTITSGSNIGGFIGTVNSFTGIGVVNARSAGNTISSTTATGNVGGLVGQIANQVIGVVGDYNGKAVSNLVFADLLIKDNVITAANSGSNVGGIWGVFVSGNLGAAKNDFNCDLSDFAIINNRLTGAAATTGAAGGNCNFTLGAGKIKNGYIVSHRDTVSNSGIFLGGDQFNLITSTGEFTTIFYTDPNNNLVNNTPINNSQLVEKTVAEMQARLGNLFISASGEVTEHTEGRDLVRQWDIDLNNQAINEGYAYLVYGNTATATLPTDINADKTDGAHAHDVDGDGVADLVITDLDGFGAGNAAPAVIISGSAAAGAMLKITLTAGGAGSFHTYVIVGNDASHGAANDGLGAWSYSLDAAVLGLAADTQYTFTAAAVGAAYHVTNAIDIYYTADAKPLLGTPELITNSDNGFAGTDTDNITNAPAVKFAYTETNHGTVTVKYENGSITNQHYAFVFNYVGGAWVFDATASTLGNAGGVVVGQPTLAAGTGADSGKLLFGFGNLTAANSTFTPIPDGPNYTVKLNATDAYGNIAAEQTMHLTYDTIAPTAPAAALALAANDDSGSNNADNLTNIARPTFTGTGNGGELITIYNDTTAVGTAYVVNGSWSIQIAALNEGANTLTYTITDKTGNESAASPALTVNYDSTAPVCVLTGGVSNLSINSTVANLTGLVAADFAGDITIGGVTITPQANGAWIIPIAELNLSDGVANRVDYTLTDQAGNRSSGSFTVTLDNILPSAVSLVADNFAPAATNAESFSFTFTVSEGLRASSISAADFQIVTDGDVTGDLRVVYTEGDTTATIIVSNVTGDGTLGLQLAADAKFLDLAGNESAVTALATANVFTIDNSSNAAGNGSSAEETANDAKQNQIARNETPNVANLTAAASTVPFYEASMLHMALGDITAIMQNRTLTDEATEGLTIDLASAEESTLNHPATLAFGTPTHRPTTKVTSDQSDNGQTAQAKDNDGSFTDNDFVSAEKANDIVPAVLVKIDNLIQYEQAANWNARTIKDLALMIVTEVQRRTADQQQQAASVLSVVTLLQRNIVTANPELSAQAVMTIISKITVELEKINNREIVPVPAPSVGGGRFQLTS